MRFTDGEDPLRALNQMVERAEKKYRIGRLPAESKVARIAAGNRSKHDARFCSPFSRLLKMESHRIDQVNPVTRLCQRERIHSGRSAHVDDRRRGRRQMADKDRLRANPLQFAAFDEQPISLAPLLVVRLDLSRDGTHAGKDNKPDTIACPGRRRYGHPRPLAASQAGYTIRPIAGTRRNAELTPQLNSKAPEKTAMLLVIAPSAIPSSASCSHDTNM